MKVVFWDFDGTLVYSGSLWSSSVFTALRQETGEKYQIEFSDIRNCMAFGFTWHTPEEDYTDIKGEKWWDFMNRHFFNSYVSLGVSKQDAVRAAERVRGIIKQKENYNLYPDTVSTLRCLRNKGVINVLLSNNYPDLTDVLKELDLIKYFDSIVISANVGFDKPRKEIFDIAKKPYPNAEYLMVGDNVIADISGGKSASMKTVLVHKGFDKSADYCFDNLSPICELF